MLYIFQGLNILHHIGLSVSYTSVQRKKRALISTQECKVRTVVNKYKNNWVDEHSESQSAMVEPRALDTSDSIESLIPMTEFSTVEKSDSIESQIPMVECKTAEKSDSIESQIPMVECKTAEKSDSIESQITMVESKTAEKSDSIESLITMAESKTAEKSDSIESQITMAESKTAEKSDSIESQITMAESGSTERGDINPVKNVKRIEVLGDNLDLTISPAHMTVDRQRKSLHWFLLMVKQNRVSYEDATDPSNDPQPNIMDIGTQTWVPDEDQRQHLKQNFIFHVSQVLTKYVKELNSVAYPEFINHTFIHLTKQKSTVLNCDLINESENSSQGMIKILQKVHELIVPHIDKTALDKVVFGGDVLTNERAFSAQSAMQNHYNDIDSLTGIVHRPEGLHREFNFLTVMDLSIVFISQFHS
jgi:hypothetical protein